mmetsp:Transcript_34353/g.88809  ORF Transcript_34353/g.88809 Transcript_34353/m.88809 type:complete len:207 (-) Transcript_34353:2274-2894(-)
MLFAVESIVLEYASPNTWPYLVIEELSEVGHAVSLRVSKPLLCYFIKALSEAASSHTPHVGREGGSMAVQITHDMSILSRIDPFLHSLHLSPAETAGGVTENDNVIHVLPSSSKRPERRGKANHSALHVHHFDEFSSSYSELLDRFLWNRAVCVDVHLPERVEGGHVPGIVDQTSKHVWPLTHRVEGNDTGLALVVTKAGRALCAA